MKKVIYKINKESIEINVRDCRNAKEANEKAREELVSGIEAEEIYSSENKQEAEKYFNSIEVSEPRYNSGWAQAYYELDFYTLYEITYEVDEDDEEDITEIERYAIDSKSDEFVDDEE